MCEKGPGIPASPNGFFMNKLLQYFRYFHGLISRTQENHGITSIGITTSARIFLPLLYSSG